MKLIIAGSREITNKVEIFEIIRKYIETSFKVNLLTDISELSIISGMAREIDSVAVKYAKENNIKLLEYPANWKNFGKSAGHIRNLEMAKDGTHLLAIWDGQSKGTKNMIDQMKKMGKSTYVVIKNN